MTTVAGTVIVMGDETATVTIDETELTGERAKTGRTGIETDGTGVTTTTTIGVDIETETGKADADTGSGDNNSTRTDSI
jgi:hypothetical protein